VLEQRRLDVQILVMGVHLEHLAHREHVPGDGGTVGSAAGVDSARGERHVEQFRPDPLVDVAVQVDGEEIEVVGRADEAGGAEDVGGDAHEMVLLVCCHPRGRLVVAIVNDSTDRRS
jgi:hypothetical protein